MSVLCPYERKFLIADQPEQLQHNRLLPDIQRRSIQDWHGTISWWRSWRGEKACCRQSTVPLKSRRETRDSVQIESHVSRIETRVTVNLLLSCMTLLSKNDALTTTMKTAEIRPLTISEQSWRQNKWEEQGHAISRCQNHINLLTHVDWLRCCWITPHHYLWEVVPANNYFQLLVCCFPIPLFSFLRNSFVQFCILLVSFTIQLFSFPSL